jgi:Flp pilus assembly protein TadD
MHKTGGQTLNEIVSRTFPDHEFVGYHYPRSAVPARYAHLPVIGFIRNPWDWYVSWYAFNKRPDTGNSLFDVMSEDDTLDFHQTISNLARLGSLGPDSRRLRAELEQRLPESLDNNRGVGLTKTDIRSFQEVDLGYYSWLFGRMFGDRNEGQVIIGKFENLEDEFLRIADQLGIAHHDELCSELNRRERRNVSLRSHYSHYYDAALRDLVASKEAALIEDFGYRYESVGVLTDDKESRPDPGQRFRKLLGHSENYLQLGEGFDVRSIRDSLGRTSTDCWGESDREHRFEVHRKTNALILIGFEDDRHSQRQFHTDWPVWKPLLKPILDYIQAYYRDNGFPARILFAKLLAHSNIPVHTDSGYSLLNCHRLHIPIVSNDRVAFYVGGEEKYMRSGEIWEINNGLDHSVENQGDDRIHLIVDWMPNNDGLPESDVLAPPASDPDIDTPTVLKIIADGNRMHQLGRLPEAESLYRSVLEQDESHVIANNLLGLLRIHSNRYEEAISFIGTALHREPDDAQAQANMGFALSQLGRLTEAREHLEHAIRLAPGDAVVHNDLGSVYRQLGRRDQAISCYRRSVAARPEFAEAHHNLGQTLLVEGRHPEAIECFELALSLKPDLQITRKALQEVRRKH